MSEGDKKESTVISFFSSPKVGIAGSIASIIGIVLSVYFYSEAREVSEFTYSVNPAKAALIRIGESSRLSTQYDGHKLMGDVTATQIAIWNAGKRPIRPENVLQRLVIQTKNNARILEARIQKVSRQVVGLELDSSRFASGEVGISWNILEQNDGGVVQLIYAGDENVEIEVRGVLEGQREIINLGYPSGHAHASARQYDEPTGNKLYFILISLLVTIVVMSVWLVAVNTEQRRKLLPLLIVSTTGLAAFLLIYYFETVYLPPFGF